MDVKQSSVPVAVSRRQHPFVEWLNVNSFLFSWAAREYQLNLEAMRLAPVDSRERVAHHAARTSRIR